MTIKVVSKCKICTVNLFIFLGDLQFVTFAKIIFSKIKYFSFVYDRNRTLVKFTVTPTKLLKTGKT